MDRFIDLLSFLTLLLFCDLKSNMDRFIVYSVYFNSKPKVFKIQYG